MQLGVKKLLYLIFAFFLAWLTVRLLLPLLSPFLFGAALAFAAEPMVRLLTGKFHLPRGVSTGIGVSITFILLCTLVLLLCAVAVKELGKLAGSLPNLAAPVQSGIQMLQTWLLHLSRHTPTSLQPLIQEKVLSIFSSGTALLDRSFRYILGFAGNLLSHIPDSALTLGTAILSGYMISAKLPQLRSQLLHRLPQEKLQRAAASIQRIRKITGSWLLAQCKLMGVTFAILLSGLLLLRMPNAAVLSLGIALVDAFPVLGTGTILLPWSLLRILQGDVAQGIGLLGIYTTITLVRSGLEPKLLGRHLGLDPLLTLICLYAGFRLWGIAGMLLAPLLAVTALQVIPGAKA